MTDSSSTPLPAASITTGFSLALYSCNIWNARKLDQYYWLTWFDTVAIESSGEGLNCGVVMRRCRLTRTLVLVHVAHL